MRDERGQVAQGGARQDQVLVLLVSAAYVDDDGVELTAVDDDALGEHGVLLQEWVGWGNGVLS
jgi:hypothetical protein